jgi:hypothetical protein
LVRLEVLGQRGRLEGSYRPPDHRLPCLRVTPEGTGSLTRLLEEQEFLRAQSVAVSGREHVDAG